MLESELKALVVQYAHSRGWTVYSQPMAKLRRPVRSANGYPDLTLARNRQVLWIECKTDDGTLRPEQMHWLRELPSMHVLRPADWHSGAIGALLR